ncbi:hypothetical protein EMGBS1_03450 [Chloroflexota bacterium]|nr:hypothetical protein EMGBS1_03450 [Chloroflexota bacterium]
MSSTLPAQLNLREQMHAALTAAQRTLVREIATLGTESGVGLYIVGGFVRDLLLGGAVREVDLVVEATRLDLRRRFSRDWAGA